MKIRAVLCVALLGLGSTAFAGANAPAGVEVQAAWIRWLPAELPTAGYATVINNSDTAVRITGASSADYRDVSLMRSLLAQDDGAMVPISYFEIPPHKSAQFVPGGYHIMLSGPTRLLKPGDKVPITLRFSDDSAIQAIFSVLPADASGPSDSG